MPKLRSMYRVFNVDAQLSNGAIGLMFDTCTLCVRAEKTLKKIHRKYLLYMKQLNLIYISGVVFDGGGIQVIIE